MTNGEFTRITKDAQQRGNLGLNIDEARKVVGHFAAGAPWTVGFSVAVIEFATLRKEISWMRTAAWDRYAIKVPSDAQNRNLCIEVKKVKVKNAAIYCQTSVTRLTESDWAHKKKHPAVLVRACDCAECQQKQQQKQQQQQLKKQKQQQTQHKQQPTPQQPAVVGGGGGGGGERDAAAIGAAAGGAAADATRHTKEGAARGGGTRPRHAQDGEDRRPGSAAQAGGAGRERRGGAPEN